MKSFDIDEYNYRECEVHNHGFYLGEQSKQAEVDELIDTIKTSAESEMYLFDELQKVKGERDELQKRIDKALNKSEDFYDFGDGESAMAFCNEIINILKGENRE